MRDNSLVIVQNTIIDLQLTAHSNVLLVPHKKTRTQKLTIAC